MQQSLDLIKTIHFIFIHSHTSTVRDYFQVDLYWGQEFMIESHKHVIIDVWVHAYISHKTEL